jgi:hypothetical protein
MVERWRIAIHAMGLVSEGLLMLLNNDGTSS